MCIDRWICDMQHLEIDRHAAELSLICEAVAKQAGTAFLSRLVAVINSKVFANGIDNILWYIWYVSKRRGSREQCVVARTEYLLSCESTQGHLRKGVQCRSPRSRHRLLSLGRHKYTLKDTHRPSDDRHNWPGVGLFMIEWSSVTAFGASQLGRVEPSARSSIFG